MSEPSNWAAIRKRQERIRELNDLARTAMGVASKLIVTPGFQALSEADKSAVRELVEKHDTWNEANDPYGEYDFGTFDYGEQEFMWKIDYYDLKYEYGSEHPEDPAQTRRVLTIMLASEY